jgi:multiple sugar transport system substrate-binding protein
VTLTFWAWQKGSKEVVDAFNASQEDIRVTFEEIPSGNAGGYAKISNAVKAGNAPDLIAVEYPQLPEFVSQGAVQDISSPRRRLRLPAAPLEGGPDRRERQVTPNART